MKPSLDDRPLFRGTAARLSQFCALLLSLAAANLIHAEENSAPVQPPIEELSPGVYQLGKLRLDKNTNTITFPAALNMNDGSVEYLLVTKEGSTHESLFTSDLQPSDLHFAMLLLGAKGAGITTPTKEESAPPQINAEYLKHAPKLKGDPLTITANWNTDGVEKSVRVEDWVLNSETKKPLSRGPWIYTGSMFSNGQFLAQTQGTFAAIVTNPSALINNPRQGNDNDLIWIVNKAAVPPRDTALQLTLQLEIAPSK